MKNATTTGSGPITAPAAPIRWPVNDFVALMLISGVRSPKTAQNYADDRKGPLRQIQKGIKTEVDFTLAHVVREGERLRIATPLCRSVLEMIHELETGKRQLGMQNYAALQAARAA